MSIEPPKSKYREGLENLAVESTNALTFRATTGIDSGVTRMSAADAALWSAVTQTDTLAFRSSEPQQTDVGSIATSQDTLVSAEVDASPRLMSSGPIATEDESFAPTESQPLELPESPKLSDAEQAREDFRADPIFNSDTQQEAARFFPEFREADERYTKAIGGDNQEELDAARENYSTAKDAVVDGTAFSTEALGIAPEPKEIPADERSETRQKADDLISKLPDGESAGQENTASAFANPSPEQQAAVARDEMFKSDTTEETAQPAVAEESKPAPKPASQPEAEVAPNRYGSAKERLASRREALQQQKGKNDSGFEQSGKATSKDDKSDTTKDRNKDPRPRKLDGSPLPAMDQGSTSANRNAPSVPIRPSSTSGDSDFPTAVVDFAQESKNAHADAAQSLRSITSEINSLRWSLREAMT